MYEVQNNSFKMFYDCGQKYRSTAKKEVINKLYFWLKILKISNK